MRYVCRICGYVYDPELADSKGNVEPGTPFKELPEEWTCPVCGTNKENFSVKK